jgi:lysophospholipase L1-like esterase
MIDTQTPELQESAGSAVQRDQRSWTRFIILVLAVLAIVLNRVYIPNIHYDLLNIIPLLATLYIGYALIALDKTCGQIDYVARCISEDPKVRKPFGAFLFSPWLRSMLLLPLLLVIAEFGLRCVSYQRSERYERQGNLLYTPIPNQEYLEKISLTQSRINNDGLRGVDVATTGKQIVLCLGDSVTYGYGVDDNHTYPAELQRALDQEFPGRYLVLNGGVDGYPTPFMREKFLYLWTLGIHPDLVVVGYSFNEGGLGRMAYADEKTKDVFASRVRMKNKVRGIALYNVVVENWARASYNRMKKYMVPGTNSRTLTAEDVQNQYQKSLQEMYDALNAHQVKTVFALFTGYDGRTGQYDNQGPFQLKFQDFAESHGAPLLLSKQVLADGAAANTDIQKYFQDQCHMKEIGTQKFAHGLADFLTPILEKNSTGNPSANVASN